MLNLQYLLFLYASVIRCLYIKYNNLDEWTIFLWQSLDFLNNFHSQLYSVSALRELDPGHLNFVQ